MNPAATLTVSTAQTTHGLRDALQAALRRVTWRVAVVTLAIGLAFDLWSMFEMYRGETALGLLSGTATNLLMAASILLTTFVADEMVAGGTRRLPAYAGAVVTGSALAAVALWLLQRWLDLRPELFGQPVPPAAVVVGLFLEYLIWGGIVVFVYVNHRTALAASARMNAAQVRRAQADRRALESRLQALQARVEPQFLFNTLARVRDANDADPARGSTMLDHLIVYLRASLPHLRDSTSTLSQELDLVRAYFGIMREPAGAQLEITADQAALAARMPAMVLLPLIDFLWAREPLASAGTLAIETHAEAGLLRVELQGGQCGSATGTDDSLRDIRDRLYALYGERATVRVLTAGGGPRIETEIPYETADGSHR